MQHNKITTKQSEFEIFNNNSEKLTSSLTNVMNKFQLKRQITIFDFLKSKGLAISSLVSILVILPFLGFASVNSLIRNGIKQFDVKAKKDVYYDVKNNEFINWRKLLFLHVKRFIYLVSNNIRLKKDGATALIFDDTTIKKTGKQIELVSMVHDHTSQQYILGYKLLVCGFWDGGSFIPIDFSLHREKGNKHLKLISACNKADNKEKKHVNIVAKLRQKLAQQKKRLTKNEINYRNKSNKTNEKLKLKSEERYEQIKMQLSKSEQELTKIQSNKQKADKELKRFYNNGKLYGLNTKERQAQFKKTPQEKSAGKLRRDEVDKSKISSMLKMISRAVKHGIIPNYVITDSWFFCFELLHKLHNLKKGTIKLISMVKLNNQNFTLCETGKKMSVKNIIKIKERKASTSKKMKSKYVKVACYYKGIRVNLFFVKMGKSKTWRLILTTDLSISFNKLIELYQIRWTIEVFFKDVKQYLHIGACQSNCFDAQIADITISMLQYIMLIYFKRVNYQQSFGDLFAKISKELIEIDLLTSLLEILKELIEILCEMEGIEFITLQHNIMQNEKFIKKFIDLFPEKTLDKAA